MHPVRFPFFACCPAFGQRRSQIFESWMILSRFLLGSKNFWDWNFAAKIEQIRDFEAKIFEAQKIFGNWKIVVTSARP
jgi:hypothetical protein